MRRKKKEPRMKAAAIIVAAGRASRMEGIDKQHMLLGDFPVIVRSIRAFQLCGGIDDIILVSREADMQLLMDYIKDYELDKVRRIVTGGETRQQSVAAGFHELAPDTGLVAIHDGARPLVQPASIALALEYGVRFGACTVGVPVKDTVKEVSEEGRITGTPERTCLYIAQTPQVFLYGLYKEALAWAERESREFTDDCQLVEHMGHPVYMAAGSRSNIKITYPEDLLLAEALLAAEEEAGSR